MACRNQLSHENFFEIAARVNKVSLSLGSSAKSVDPFTGKNSVGVYCARKTIAHTELGYASMQEDLDDELLSEGARSDQMLRSKYTSFSLE